jgi:hypothetical protein
METQAIREIERSVAAKVRGIWPRRRVDPLRETAEGLGVVLDRLSHSVAEADERRYDIGGEDSVESEFAGGRRTRGFKLHGADRGAEVAPAAPTAPATDEAPAAPAADGAPAETTAADNIVEQAEALSILQEARNIAADATAPPIVMPAGERAAAKEKLQALFQEFSAKRIEIVSSIFSDPDGPSATASAFSLATPNDAKNAYNSIDAMIMKFLNAGRTEEPNGATGANAVYSGHEAALNATEQLKQFLITEGPEKAFSRFREVNRSNILGLTM